MIQLVKPGREVESVTIFSGKQVTLGEGWWLEPPLGSKWPVCTEHALSVRSTTTLSDPCCISHTRNNSNFTR